jgi:hypothetical protein
MKKNTREKVYALWRFLESDKWLPLVGQFCANKKNNNLLPDLALRTE